MDGTEQGNHSATVSVGPSEAKGCLTFDKPEGLSSVFFLKLMLTSSDGDLLSENLYWSSPSGEDYSALNDLPTVTLDAEAVHGTGGEEEVVTASLGNASSNVAFSIRLKLLRNTSGKRVLPAYYEDNYFTLLPGESRDIAMRFDERYLDGEEPKLMVEGYNIDETEIEITSLNLANPRAVPRADAAPRVSEVRVHDALGRLVARLSGDELRGIPLSPSSPWGSLSRYLPSHGVYVVVARTQRSGRVVSKRILVK
jgi:hypothetical protein